jgi:hypothetical protein
MTHRDFMELAEAFRLSRPAEAKLCKCAGDRCGFQPPHRLVSEELLQWERTREAVATACLRTNPRFNKERWIGDTEQSDRYLLSGGPNA